MLSQLRLTLLTSLKEDLHGTVARNLGQGALLYSQAGLLVL